MKRAGIRSIARSSHGEQAETDRNQEAAADERAADRAARKSSRLARKGQQKEPVLPPASEKDGGGSEEYLKRGLEQIAASREKGRSDGDWIKELSPDELELVGQILKQYLA